MSRPISMNVPHNLGKEEAHRRLDEGFGGIQQQMTGGMGGMLAFKRSWDGRNSWRWRSNRLAG